MLAIQLKGGLGNQLFQIAAADTISLETGRKLCLVNDRSPKTVHNDNNYFESVLSSWKNRPILPSPYTIVTEPSFAKHDWSGLLHTNLCLDGYFQNWKYVHPSFQSKLCLPSSPSLPGAFLHIRGGDYVNHWVHDIGLSRGYYERALAHFPTGTHFYIFTNDTEYAKRFTFLSNIPHTFMESDELTSIAQMASCSAGGICANSSFSWWGAYLNPNRTIVMPDKWFNDPGFYTDGYYFPGVQKCSV